MGCGYYCTGDRNPGNSLSFEVRVEPRLTDSNLFPLSTDPDYVVSKELQSKFSYDALSQELSFQGVMQEADRNVLKSVEASLSQQLQDLIDALYEMPRQFMERNLKTVVLPEQRANLAEWPPGVEIPSELRAKVFYDFENKALDSGGALTPGEEGDQTRC